MEEDDSVPVALFMAAVFRARDALLRYAGGVWSEGTYEYVLGGRKSLFHGSHWEDAGRSDLVIGEEIGLEETRTLGMTIAIGFTLTRLTVSGEIVVSREVPEGFDEQEILTLPKRTTRSVAQFATILENYVREICANPRILDGIAVRKQ